MPPTFRFPPFPLASVEEPEPQISTESEPDDTNIFESPTVEYRALYERLPQPSVDILIQVRESLPEMLPEPETDPDSIFEDKSNDDYVGISISSTPPITSTRSLEMLVADRNYDDALRVLDELLEVGTDIPFSSAYESAAMSAIKAPATTTTEMDDQVRTFKKWFSLILPADQSRPRTFRTLRDRILLSPLNSLRLIMEFGLIAAEKGYARSTHYQVTTLVSMYGDPDVTLRFIEELRHRNRIFLERSSKIDDIDNLDNRLRVDIVGVAVRTLANAGRFEHAVQLIPDPLETIFHLTPYTYNFLLHKMEMTGDPRYIPHINFIAQHKQEATFRSVGLKKMAKPTLVLAIRCLANIGQFNLAIGLLPKFLSGEAEVGEAGAGLITDALDFLLAKLRESGDGQYSTYIDYISQLRAAREPMPPPIPVSASSSSDIAEAQLGLSQLQEVTEPITPASPVSATTSTDVPETQAPSFGAVEYHDAIEALTRAWCLEEALALIPVYHRLNTRHHIRVYNPLLWKLKTSCNPKYQPYLERIRQLREQTVGLAAQERATRRAAKDQRAEERRARRAVRRTEESDIRSEAEAARHLEDFSGEDILIASSLSASRPPRRIGSDLAASLRALKKAFRALTPSHRPHPLSVVRFFEVYLASGRTRAIPLLRSFVLRRAVGSSLSYIFAEMLFHARRQDPDLVIQTFVTHFFIVGLPRDELLLRMKAIERDPATAALWQSTPKMKLFPYPIHAAVVWRALLELTTDERALEVLYAKLLRFADLRSTHSSALHGGVPLLRPPPSWQTGVDASAFTPFIRRMCLTFGTDRGGQILQEMVRLGIQPNIYQLTELAMAYSRAGDVRKTMVVLDQVENATKAWEAAEQVDASNAVEQVDSDNAVEQAQADAAARRRRAQRNHHLPRVDQVFYQAVIRGFLLSNQIEAAKDVERRMRTRYGYVPGKSQHLDNIYVDLRAAEQGKKIVPHPPLLSVAHSTKYRALLENHQNSGGPTLAGFGLEPVVEPPSSAGV
ncbi:hypothetical protein B0H19DRAFT_1248449 [Mycena capillaripes]|nr:hypothetical protein B0H19DRAFT_1248449 [Mycena capillaripes]